jgi:hypothetical protein
MSVVRALPAVFLALVCFPVRAPGADCNQNGIDDAADIAAATSADCNRNRVPDECDVSGTDFAFAALPAVDLDEDYPAMDAADLDGDGDVDVAVAAHDAGTVSIYRNAGDGTVGDPLVLPVPGPRRVLARDFDGDGSTDFVTTNRDETISFHWNLGNQSFEASPALETRDPFAMESADFDRDGDPDLAVVTSPLAAGYLSILWNQGDRVFALSPSQVVDGVPQSIVVADLDGDDDTDLAVGGFRLQLFFNQAGSLIERMLPHGLDGQLSAGDVDQDGDVDLGASSRYAFSVHWNRGDGSFDAPSYFANAAQASAVAEHDLDRDGYLDLIGVGEKSDSLFVSRGKAGATFAPGTRWPVGKGGLFVLTAEMNGDSWPDVLVLRREQEQPNRLTVLLNMSRRSLAHECNASGVLDACEPDCDRDGTPDDCEIASGESPDATGNGIPDACEADCNQNGTPDVTDLEGGASKDCNLNGIPDECDLAPTLGFVTASRHPTGEQPISVAAGEMDGDGDPDLVAALFGSHELAVLDNLGGHAFAEARPYPSGPNPDKVALADFDRDGDLDAAYIHRGADYLTILHNQGAGVLGEPLNIPTGIQPALLRPAELSGDAAPDLLVADESLTLAVLVNAGDGTFASVFPHTIPKVFDVALADLDQDGDLDVGASSFYSDDVYILTNAGDGHLEEFGIPRTIGGRYIVAGDVDADSDTDLVVISPPDSLDILRNDPEDPFSDQVFARRQDHRGAHGLAGGDLDGDQRFDVVAANPATGSLAVYWSSAEGAFQEPLAELNPGIGPAWPLIADLDQDGNPDVAAVSLHSPEIAVVWQPRPRAFEAIESHGVGQSPRVVIAEDLDGDGLRDLAAADSQGISFLKNLGTGDFAAAVKVPEEGSSPHSLVPADFDGDGDPDLVSARSYSRVWMLLNDHEFQFSGPTPHDAGESPTSTAAQDFDRDGDLDLAVVNHGTNNLTLLWNDGAAAFPERSNLEVREPSLLCTFDPDADGAADLAVADIRGGVVLLRNRGDGAFNAPTPTGNLDQGTPSVLLSGDVDGDGAADLAVASSAKHVLWNQGDGTFQTTVLPQSQSFSSLVLGDLDRDGLTDLAGSFHGEWEMGIYRNAGDRTFAGPVRLPAPRSSSMAAAYLDGDGDLDLALGAEEGDAVAILWNQADRASFLDCDGNGVRDEFDLHVQADCNGNDLPDRLDITWKRSADCNRNDTPDECDIAFQLSTDLDGNGIPDECGPLFHRGDPDDSGTTNIADAIGILNYLFLGGREVSCLEAADSNNDGSLNITDPVHLLTFLFLGGAPPAPPGPPRSPCGRDPDAQGSVRDLGCATYRSCAG